MLIAWPLQIIVHSSASCMVFLVTEICKKSADFFITDLYPNLPLQFTADLNKR